MSVKLKAVVTAENDVRLALPDGRHLASGGWFVAADTTIVDGDRLLILRIWSPADDGCRVIVVDKDGGERESVRARTYKEALGALRSVDGASSQHTHVDGRRLVSGGDGEYEIAAEVHGINGEDLLLVRVWLHVKQRFTVYAIDHARVVRAHDAAATYRKTVDAITEHLLA